MPTDSLLDVRRRKAVHGNEDQLITPQSSPLTQRKSYGLSPRLRGVDDGLDALDDLRKSFSSDTEKVDGEVDFEEVTVSVKLSTVTPSPNKNLYPDLSQLTKERVLTTKTKRVIEYTPQFSEDVEPEAHQTDKRYRWKKSFWIPLLLLSLAVLGGSFYVWRSKQREGGKPEEVPVPSRPSYQEMQQNLLKGLQSMKKQYPGQSRESWVTWLAAINSTLQESPEQPSTLILASNNGLTHNCLAKNLAAVINSAFGKDVEVPVIDLVALSQRDTDGYKVKKLLDEDLKYALNQSHAVVLENIQQLPPEAVMLLHGYCDNLVAPFKDRVLILTLTMPPDQRDVDSYLDSLWTPHLGVDTSSSIISRVSNHAVVVRRDERDGCTPLNPF